MRVEGSRIEGRGSRVEVVGVCRRGSRYRVEGRPSKIKFRWSGVESLGSRVKGQGSRVGVVGSRVQGRRSRVQSVGGV
eukprot:657295-Rhodomonas_salina.2